ncbi:MAG: hypothetical protein WD004_08260 [Actinomycetota bacterium]
MHLRRKLAAGSTAIQAALVSTLAGAWAANLLYDEQEYVRAGIRPGTSIHLPIMVQTMIILGVVLFLRHGQRVSSGPSRPTTVRAFRHVAGLTGFQVAVFLAMELSERLVVGPPSRGSLIEGLLESSLVMELVVAVISAVLLTPLASAAVRMITGGPPPDSVTADSRNWSPIWLSLLPTEQFLAATPARGPPD